MKTVLLGLLFVFSSVASECALGCILIVEFEGTLTLELVANRPGSQTLIHRYLTPTTHQMPGITISYEHLAQTRWSRLSKKANGTSRKRLRYWLVAVGSGCH